MGQTPNTLYYGDNLDILRRYVADESVDLVYLDPPFNSNADYNVLFAEKDAAQSHAQIKAFGDTWKWDTEAAANFQDALQSGAGRVPEAMTGLKSLLGTSDMMAYLAMMAPRLVELRRVLKPTGSIYLHCDPTASHYLKVLMDAAFGPENLRAEIIWKRTSAHGNATSNFAAVHDTILFYSKTRNATWNRAYQPYDEDYVKEHFVHRDADGRLFRRTDLRNPSFRPNLIYDYKGYKPHPNGWAIGKEKMEELDREGKLFFPKKGTSGRIRRKLYLDDSPGTPVSDVWADIAPIHAAAAERLGYPTQKPEALLERIIAASSNKGDVILDPFCGCGTAIAAAQKLDRRWIGIDITHLAIKLIKGRLVDAFGPQVRKTYEVVGEPTDLEGARALAEEDKYQFQYWALGLAHDQAEPTADQQKKGADKGIDGRLYLTDREGETKSIIISVKGGNVSVPQVRDLRGVIERENAAMGVFITLNEPTAPMRSEAADAGFWQTEAVAKSKHPRLQILTIADLLAGKRIDMPAQLDIRSFKQAPKAKKKKKQEDPSMF